MILKPALRRQSGFGLIEVMAVVLILSIAFLGLAALVTRALSTNNTAMARSVATVAAYSIQDAMRADSAHALAYNNTTVSTNSCSAAGTSLKDVQISQWCQQLMPLHVPNKPATGAIQCVNSPNGSPTSFTCVVTIIWDDSRNGTIGGSNTQTVTTVSML